MAAAPYHAEASAGPEEDTMTGSEKITSLDDYRSNEDGAIPAESKDKTSRDMGKVAIFISILSVLLLVVFFFGLNQNIKGLASEMRTMGSDVGQLKTAMAELPGQVRRSIVADELQATISKLDHLRGKVTPEEAAMLAHAVEQLKLVQGQVAK